MDETSAIMTTVRLGRVLIVDDEVELMTASRDVLSERGYEVAAFSEARDALAALREGTFDALLTDLMMPGMGGIELIGEALKVDPNLVPIIMTGQGTVQTAVEAMQSGAFDYVLKPFKLTAILPVLSRAIEVRRLRTEVMHLRETVAIHDLCKAITHTLDFDILLHKVADAAMQQCEADEVSIVLPTRDGKELYVAAVRGRHEKAILGQRMPIGEGVAGWVAQHHEPLVLHGPVNDKRFRPLAPRVDIVSSICMPMSVGGNFVGVLNVNATKRTRPFTLGDVKALTVIASIASPVLEGGWLFTQIREAEEKYRSIFENSIDGIFQTTPDGQYLEANPALARMYGYDSPADLMASVTDIARRFYVDPRCRAEFVRLMEERDSVVAFESQVYRKDGSVIWISESARAIRDADNRLLHYEGTTGDITARKQAEEALRESEERLRLALSSSRVGTWSWNIPENSIVWDDYLHPLFGLKPGTFPGSFEDFANMVHPGDRARVAREVTNCVNEGAAYDSEFRIVWPDGSVHYLASRAKVYGDESDRPLRMTGICWDVSERKRAEGRQAAQHAVTSVLSEACSLIAASPKILQAICETTGWEVGAVWQVDREANELRCVELWHSPSVEIPQFETMCRQRTFASGIGLPGRVWCSGTPAWIPDVIVDSNFPRAPVAKKEGLHGAFGFPILLGREFLGVIEFFSREIREPDDDLLQVFTAIGNQIGQFIERQQAEENLHESKHKLEEALNDLQRAQSKIIEQERLRALGEMASGIAHDFNNALGPILGFSELLLRRPENLDDKAKVTRYLQMMNTGVKDAASVVNRLREFYRKRDDDEVFLPIEINPLVEQVISFTQPRWKDQALADGKTVRLSTQLEAVASIAGNEHQLREVLTNLIFNAVDALSGDGEVVLRTYQEGDHVMLQVSDTGTGMTEKVRKRCLEPFFSTKGVHGTGLGLPMVHGIVRRHDGTVDIDSKVGGGTTISLRFPVLRAEVAAPIKLETTNITRPLRVLVADDEPGMREITCEYLLADGHTVVGADDGSRALQEFYAGRFDLVITDRAMPKMNGDQLAATIAKTAPGKPVIMLSGFGDLMNATGELPEGVKLIIGKPVTLAALRQAVVKVLQ